MVDLRVITGPRRPGRPHDDFLRLRSLREHGARQEARESLPVPTTTGLRDRLGYRSDAAIPEHGLEPRVVWIETPMEEHAVGEHLQAGDAVWAVPVEVPRLEDSEQALDRPECIVDRTTYVRLEDE